MTGLGSTMGEFFVQIAKVMELFLETGSIEIFFKILTKALKVVETVFSNEIVSQVFVYLAALKAVSLAFGTIGNVFKFFGGATVISPLKKMFEFFGKGGGLSKFLTGLSQGTGTIGKFLNPGGKMNLLSVFGKIGKFAGPLAAVVAVFIEMWQNSEIFRESIQNFLSGVWESLVEAFDTIKLALQDASPAFEGISKNFGKMGEVFGKLGDIIGKYVMPVLQFLVTTIIKGIGQAIAFLIRILAPVIKVMMDMAGVIWDVVKVAFDILIKGVDFIIGAFQILSDFLAPFWDILITGLKVIWELVKVYFGVIFTFWKFVIGKIFEIGKGIWNFIFDKVKIVWDKAKEVLGAIGGFVKGIVEKVGGFLKGIWDFIDIKGKWNTVKGYIENTLIPYVQSIPGKFGAALSGMWDFLSNGLSAAWGAAKRWWNQNVAGKGFSISVPGTDFGVDLKIPKLARGGVVYPGMGGAGTLAMIAEAGRPERVEPLDAQGLSQRDRAIIAEIAGMYGNPRGKDMTINVHPSPGMDERALAYMVNRRIEASRLRGI
jgi:phage-related protein